VGGFILPYWTPIKMGLKMTGLAHEGRCLCGEIVFHVNAEPIHTTICHCKMCQRSTGSNYLIEPIFKLENLDVCEGQTTVYTHISDVSKLALHINFCKKCGTKLFQTFERFPEVVGVFGGTFDNPNWFSRTKENTRHIFVASAAKDTVLPAGFALYDQHTADAETGEKLKPYLLSAHKMVD
jgi:hypothetical protein